MQADSKTPITEEEQPETTSSRKWYEWYDPGTSHAEKVLLAKLDWSLLLFVALSFFVKYLDQINVTNAFVSGMKVQLHLNSNQFNWFMTTYNLGVVVGAPLILTLLTFIPANIVLSTCLMLMSGFALFIYKAQSAETVYILRFFDGLFSAGVLPGAFYLIGSWYKKHEIARRSTLAMISFYAGGMFSGPLQTGLRHGMNGHLGLAAWRWLFIFDAIIGIPVFLFGYIFCPTNEPRARKPWWMTEKEHELAIKRMMEDDRDPVQHFRFPQDVPRILKSWQLWCFPLAYGCLLNTCGVIFPTLMTLYLNTQKTFSKDQVNNIPVAVSGGIIVTMLIAGWITDYTRSYPSTICILSCVLIFAYAVFVAWPANQAFLIAMYLIGGAAYGAIFPLLTAWANTECGGDKYLRAITTSLMETIGYLGEGFAQLHFFQTVHAPHYQQEGGYIWSLCWACAALFASCVFIPLVRRVLSRRKAK